MTNQPLIFGEVIQSFLDESKNDLIQSLVQSIEEDNGIESRFSFIELSPNVPNSIDYKLKGGTDIKTTTFEKVFKQLFKEYDIKADTIVSLKFGSSKFEPIIQEFKEFFRDEKYIQIWDGSRIPEVYDEKNWTHDLKGVPRWIFDLEDSSLQMLIDNCRVVVMVNGLNQISGMSILWKGQIGVNSSFDGHPVDIANDTECAKGMEIQFYRFYEKNDIAYYRYIHKSNGHRFDWKDVLLYQKKEQEHAQLFIKNGIKSYLETKPPYIQNFEYTDEKDLFNYIEKGVGKKIRFRIHRDYIYPQFVKVVISPKKGTETYYVNTSGNGSDGYPRSSYGSDEIVWSDPYGEYYMKDDVISVSYGGQGYHNTYVCHKEYARLEYSSAHLPGFTASNSRTSEQWIDKNLYQALDDFSNPLSRKVWEYCFVQANADSKIYPQPIEDKEPNSMERKNLTGKFTYTNRSITFSMWKRIGPGSRYWLYDKKLKPGGIKRVDTNREIKFKIKLYPTRVVLKCQNERGRTQEWRYDDWADFNERCYRDIYYYSELA